MRASILTGTAIITLAAATAAFPAQTTSGTVGAFDKSAGTFLISGHSYQLPQNASMKRLGNGDKVSLVWDGQGDPRQVKSFSIEHHSSGE